MPLYTYRCPNGHPFEIFKPLSDYTPTERCPSCRREAERTFTPHSVNGCMMSDKTRELLSAPFGRERAATFREARDVERALDVFEKKNPHLGRPELA